MVASLSSLWESVTSVGNLSVALHRAQRNKFRTPTMSRILRRRDEMIAKLRTSLIDGTFHTGEYIQRTIFEPKRRDIAILPFYPDRIVHHALMNVIAPIWDMRFIRDSYACRPGRGIHAASRRIMGFIRKNRFYLQCDISKFYPNIRHDLMYELVCKSLRTDVSDTSPLLATLRDIIDSVPGPRGMPIGNLTSQWLGNLYMHELDTYIKQTLRVRYYVRYCDDFVLFASDRGTLRCWRDCIERFLANYLGLKFSYAQIAPVEHGLDFCGYRHFPDRILLRRRTVRRMRDRIKKINRIPISARRESPHIRGQIASMHGWTKHSSITIPIPEI